MKIPQFTRGLAVGATAVYVLDRARGRRRRITLRDRARHFVHQVEKAAGRATRDVRNWGREPRFELRQRDWSPIARVLTDAGDAVIAITSRGLPSPVRQLTSLFGLRIVARVVTSIESKRLVGVRAGRRAVVLQKTMDVAAPIDKVFDFFSRVENFPRFMAHLIDVQRTSDRTSHWLARGPAGMPFHWVAEITSLEPNRKLAWRSAAGASVPNAGIVRFDRTPDGGTRVDIRLTYNPAAGAVGHRLASLLGADPQQALDEDLVRFKSLMEHGTASVHGKDLDRVELSATKRDA